MPGAGEHREAGVGQGPAQHEVVGSIASASSSPTTSRVGTDIVAQAGAHVEQRRPRGLHPAHGEGGAYGVVLGEDAQVLLVGGEVAATQGLAGGAVAVLGGDRCGPHAVVGVGEGERVGAEGVGVLGGRGAVAAARDDEAEAALGVARCPGAGSRTRPIQLPTTTARSVPVASRTARASATARSCEYAAGSVGTSEGG